MGYVPLNNYNHDGGYKRIQSGPNHQGFIILTSGSTAYGANEGIIVPGSPLSGTTALGAWDYDSNWRYVPSTLPSQSGVLDPTPYNVSGALDTYDGTRIYTRDNVGGAQAASAIGPETGKINPRGGALQPRANVTRPETYMYYGGAAPDNQDYSPYNTPDANSAAEGKTGGGVTHRSYESTLLTNVLGSQGTSDRSQWRYHQPVYCKTYTETRRSGTPGLMSTPLRFVYRGSATSYVGNFGYQLLAGPGFELLAYDEPEEIPEEIPIGPFDPAPFPGGPEVLPPVPVCEGAVITRISGNIGDEENVFIEEDVDFTIPSSPDSSIGGGYWDGKFVIFRWTCPDGAVFVADPINVEIDPLNYGFWRYVTPGGPSGWYSTTNIRAVWLSAFNDPPVNLKPITEQEWFGGGGTITVEAGSVGGVLGQFVARIITSGQSAGTNNIIGSVSPNTPFSFIPYTFEFTDDTIQGNILASWAGYPDESPP